MWDELNLDKLNILVCLCTGGVGVEHINKIDFKQKLEEQIM